MSDDDVVFGDVVEFVETYIRQVYQRQVSDLADTVWCPEWWRHHEATVRLTALWRAWEGLHGDPRGGLSHWLLQHADRQMNQLFDPRGPFKYCSVRNGHRDMLGPLPVDAPPTAVVEHLEMFTELNGGRPSDSVYAGGLEFVTEFIAPLYHRQVTDLSDTVWCPQWWQHHEAVVRFDALWRAWEYYRVQPAVGVSKWFIEHADPHMAQLFAPKGPFKSCTVRGGHRSRVSPLPVAAVAEGLFTDPDDFVV